MTRIANKGTTIDDDANITNDDDEDFSDGFQVAMTEKEDTIELTDDLQPLIAKVCIVVKLGKPFH
jgi:hypothetical protein